MATIGKALGRPKTAVGYQKKSPDTLARDGNRGRCFLVLQAVMSSCFRHQSLASIVVATSGLLRHFDVVMCWEITGDPGVRD